MAWMQENTKSSDQGWTGCVQRTVQWFDFNLPVTLTKTADEDANDTDDEDAEATVAHGNDDHTTANVIELHLGLIISSFKYLSALY